MKKKGAAVIAIAVALIFVSLYFDSPIVQAVSLARNSYLDYIFLGITFASSAIIIFFVLTSLFLWNEKKRRWILPLWITLAVTSVISFLLKITIRRERPYQLGIVSAFPSLQEAAHNIWDFSFPSLQSAIVFCALPILNREFPKMKYAWTAFAVLVAFSRIYFGVHFLSDVIAGALIGYLIGVIAVKLEKEYKLSQKILYGIFGK